MSSIRLICALAGSLALAACAHPMNIKPDVAALQPVQNRIPKNVGLYIPPADHALEVTTAGGGGDKVRYHPYADLETGIYKVLGDVFANVTAVSAPNDPGVIAQHSLSYIVTPSITTTSSSSGVFTWMATDFTVEVVCRVTDPQGKEVATVSSTGVGKADSSEVRSDFSIAGERASNEALEKLQQAFLQAPQLK